jgi:hypothetical protein
VAKIELDVPGSSSPYVVLAVAIRRRDQRVVHHVALGLETIASASHALQQLREAYGEAPAIRPALAGERLIRPSTT